jgi:CSLREA domain-containing protein
MTERAQPLRRPGGRRVASLLTIVFLLLVGMVPFTPAARGAVIILVTTTSDAEFPADGLCSLRAAILASNSGGIAGYCGAGTNEQDSIRFSLGSGVPVINVGSSLPTITHPATINGNTGGATKVRLDGSGSGSGLTISGSGTTVRNLVINGFEVGVSNSASNVTLAGNVITNNVLWGINSNATSVTIGGTTGVTLGGPCTGSCNLLTGNSQGIVATGTGVVQGNFIGTNAAGTTAQPNGHGVGVSSGTWTIGGADPAARNVISGNSFSGMGVGFGCNSCVVEGNLIGTNASGTAALPNGGDGLSVSGGSNARIGGSAAGAGNVIAGNAGRGIVVYNASGAIIQGNRIGVSSAGITLGNGSTGIHVGGGSAPIDGASIGSAVDPAAANVVAHNGGAGIRVTGPASMGPVHHVEIRGNSVYSNAAAGIVHDGTVNGNIDPPTITGLRPLTGTACANCTIDVYSDNVEEGRIYEGAITADPGGNWTFPDLFVGPNVTATATDGAHNTSEFSGPLETTNSPFTDIATSGFEDEIEWLYANGITAGCSATRYCPKGTVTREQMASFLARMFRLPPTGTDFFTDDETSTHEGNINRLAAAGITTGCSPTTFCPKAEVTRAQMASFIARAADLTVGGGRDYFDDDDASTHEANIDRIAAAGITTGCGSFKYCPSSSVTREQMAAFLRRILVPASSPPYPAPPAPGS